MSDVHGPSLWPIFEAKPVRGARQIFLAATAPADSVDQEWSHGGTVNPSADETGPPWPAPFNLRLNTLYLTLQTVSNVALVVHTFVNGVDVDNRTLTIGNAIQPYAVNIAMNSGDTLQPRLIAAATGTGIGLGIIYRYTHA